METKTTSKGQIVIPAEARQKLGITEGTRIKVEVDEEARRIILKPITRDSVAQIRGKYRSKRLLKSLMEDRKREKAR